MSSIFHISRRHRWRGNRAGLGAVAAAALSICATATADPYAGIQTYADVVNTTPIYQTVRVGVPTQQCYTQQVQVDQHPGSTIAGTLIGGALGGLVGNQFGRGSGNAAMTAAGAVVGAGVGNSVARANDQPGVAYQQHCDTVTQYHDEQHPAGFDVTYNYAGQYYHTHLPYDPGRRLLVNVSVVPAGY